MPNRICLSVRRSASVSPREAQRELDLPRIENRSRRTVSRIRRAFKISRWRCRTIRRRGVEWAKISRAISRVEEAHVDRIENVEGLRNAFQVQLFRDSKSSRNPQVDRLEAVAFEGISWFDADAVVIAEHVAIPIPP